MYCRSRKKKNNNASVYQSVDLTNFKMLPAERGTEMNATAATKNELSMSILMPNHLVVIR